MIPGLFLHPEKLKTSGDYMFFHDFAGGVDIAVTSTTLKKFGR
jgi:hypothetical protein